MTHRTRYRRKIIPKAQNMKKRTATLGAAKNESGEQNMKMEPDELGIARN
jgi:hypothetical protein